jgi:hypothetical protein
MLRTPSSKRRPDGKKKSLSVKLRRRVQVGLNKGEARNALARESASAGSVDAAFCKDQFVPALSDEVRRRVGGQ